MALREAQRKLGDKVKEVGQLRESLERMQRNLAPTGWVGECRKTISPEGAV